MNEKIQKVSEKIEGILKEINSFLVEAEELEAKKQALYEDERRVRVMESDLNEEKDRFESRKNELDQRDKFIVGKGAELQKKEESLQALEQKGRELVEYEQSLDTREANIKSLELDLEAKKQEAAKVDERAAELDHREALLKKEMLVDAERKRQLDAQAAANTAEGVRLQALAEEWQKRGIIES